MDAEIKENNCQVFRTQTLFVGTFCGCLHDTGSYIVVSAQGALQGVQ